MASSLEDDLSCSVCCELFEDPQLLSCGHSFCRCCLKKHWTVSHSRICPICRQTSGQKPVNNLALKNTCESYLKEKERKNGRDNQCPQHAEEIVLYCKTDEVAICPSCRKCSHITHKVQPLEHAVRRRKEQVKAALRPAEKALESLQKGNTQNTKIAKYIQSQAQQAEKQIKEEFEKFHKFLKEEEESRITALKKEEDKKRGKVEEMIERNFLSVSAQIKEVKEELENDGVMFLQNYDLILQRAQYTITDSDPGSKSLINMAEHVGNLGFRVWEKMTDVFSYYPVTLDPNTAPADFYISENLVSVGKSYRSCQIPVLCQENHLVLGSEGYTDGFHSWDVEVGNSKYWTIGVCQRPNSQNSAQPMTPTAGFWGLRRKGDSYSLLLSNKNPFRLNKNLKRVQVQLGYWYASKKAKILSGWRTVSFLDANDETLIAFCPVPNGIKLFPFLIPEERFSPLRIAPGNVSLQIENNPLFVEVQNTDLIGFLYVIGTLIALWIIFSTLVK